MTTQPQPIPTIDDEVALLSSLVPLKGQDIIELGCGAAKLARDLLQRYPDNQVTGVEVDQRQHAKNMAAPAPGLHFVEGVAQAIPFPDASFDLAVMLKSLHHVPQASMADALAEIDRVLRPGGHLYVNEPVFDGPLNEVIRLYNDEQLVRAAAQKTLDAALATGHWQQTAEQHFTVTVRFADFAEFARRMIGQTYANHQLDAATLAAVRQRFEAQLGADGALFLQPAHVRLLRKTG